MDRNASPPAALLQAALETLPHDLRETLLLVRVDGLSYAEAGQRLGVPASEVERRIARALARLDREMERMKWQGWRIW